MKLIVIALAALLTACESCEEMGGRIVPEGKVHIRTAEYPKYRCEYPHVRAK